MSENKPTQPQVSSDEIDLREVFKAIGNFFLMIWNGVIDLIIQFRRITIDHYKLIVGITVLAVVIGFVQFKKTTPYYKSSMVLRSTYLNSRLVENTLQNLNQLMGGNNGKGLKEVLGISQEQADNIIRFEAEPFVSEEEIIEMEKLRMQFENAKISAEISEPILAQLQLANERTFQISALVYDPALVKGLDVVVFNYIRSNTYVNKRIEANEIEMRAQLKKLEEEQPKIDSLTRIVFSHVQNISNRRREGSDNVIIGEEQVPNPQSLIAEGINLNNQKLRIEKELQLKTDFELVDGFAPYYEPESLGVAPTIEYSFFAGLLLSYLIITIIGLNRWLSRLEKERFKK